MKQQHQRREKALSPENRHLIHLLSKSPPFMNIENSARKKILHMTMCLVCLSHYSSRIIGIISQNSPQDASIFDIYADVNDADVIAV